MSWIFSFLLQKKLRLTPSPQHSVSLQIHLLNNFNLCDTIYQRFPDCVPKNTSVLRDVNRCSMEINEQPNIYIYICFLKLNLNLAHLITVYNTVHIRIFIRTFHLVTKRSRCSRFYFINEGPHSILYVFHKYFLS